MESNKQLAYALVTPARNEEALIEKTIESMVQQTVPPVKWVIVDDGSVDTTAEYCWLGDIQNWTRVDQRCCLMCCFVGRRVMERSAPVSFYWNGTMF